jgi:hypothetical protein
MKLIEGFDSNYRYILVAARRAGKVKWEIPETRSAAEQAAEVLDKAFGDA